MGRKKIITDEALIALIDDYFYRVIDGNVNQLKLPAVGAYVRHNGYPELKDYIIRRSEAALAHIQELKAEPEDEALLSLVSFKTIDVDEFIEKNHGEAAMKRALSELSLYYKHIAESAVKINEKYKAAVNTSNENEKTYKEALKTSEAICENEKRLKEENKSLKHENKRLRDIVDTYVYPEIANELLKQSGLIKETQGIVDEIALSDNIIKADTVVKSDSKIIQNMFDRFKE